MSLENLSTEKLEEMDARNTRTLAALKAWSNRDLSAAKRLALAKDIRERQDAITTELMKREGLVA